MDQQGADKSLRKTEHPGFVETPTRRTRASRQSTTASTMKSGTESPDVVPRASEATNGALAYSEGEKAHGKASTQRKDQRKDTSSAPVRQPLDPKIDHNPVYEFGGSWGVTAMMLGFPILMWYMWIGATYFDGHFPAPENGEDLLHFSLVLINLVYTGAFPNLKAWVMYWGFLIFQVACYLYLPGITVYGKPLKHEGDKRLEYYCSGVWSFYTTVAAAAFLHVTGLFKLYSIIDEFGPIMSVAIISGFFVSIIAYVSALYRGKQHRMTGHHIYDFFMGAELNPRMFGLLDFKMFFEVRLPWYILFLITCGAAARQYELFGYVSAEMGFMLLAHFLYTNACAKGEEMIVTTWDMYYEKWGFMLIFWNLAGVPFSYCHSTIYLANHEPSVYRWNRGLSILFFASYVFVYWVWDTCNSQKNRFRQEECGTMVDRKAFPQLPWQKIQKPKIIKTQTGSNILVDGWYSYARKIHYTCDLYFALSWGLITGFASPFPWFYAFFFCPMILHRAHRDNERCQDRYGDAWTEYRRQVPYLFIPASAIPSLLSLSLLIDFSMFIE